MLLAAMYYLGVYVAVRSAYGAFVGGIVLACASVPMLVDGQVSAEPRRRLGALVWLVAVLLAVLCFILADRSAHSVSDTMISFLPLLGLIVSAAWRISAPLVASD